MNASSQLTPRVSQPRISNTYLAMVIYLISTIMLFTGLFSTYFYVRGANPQPLPTTGPTILTMLSCLSIGTMLWAYSAFHRRQPRQTLMGLGLTAALGIVFLALTFREYSVLTFSFREGSFAASFYMVSGFHVLHLFAGLIMLLVMGVGVSQGIVNLQRKGGFQATTTYWLIIQLIWLALYILIYLLQ